MSIRRAIYGVDLHSEFQRGFDFQKMADAGQKFAILKASQGAGYGPPGFQGFAREAIKYMHVTGCYHFLDGTAPGAVQARHFLDAMGTVLGKSALVLWIDDHEQEYGQGLLNGHLAED